MADGTEVDAVEAGGGLGSGTVAGKGVAAVEKAVERDLAGEDRRTPDTRLSRASNPLTGRTPAT
jgi:hypothetical protein